MLFNRSFFLDLNWANLKKQKVVEILLRQPGGLLIRRSLVLRPQLAMGLPFREKLLFSFILN